MTPPVPPPTIGRVAHYVLPDGLGKGEHRPAMIVRTFNDPSLVCLRLWLDPDRDVDLYDDPIASWRSAVHFDPDGSIGTWYWPVTW